MAAKRLLKDNSFEFQERDVNNMEILEELTTKYPEAQTLPVIEIDDFTLIGYDEDEITKKLYEKA